MFRNKWLILLSIGLTGGSTVVLADNHQENPSWYILPQFGVMAPDESTIGGFAGIKLGKRIADSLDVQVGYTHGQTKDRQAGYVSSEYSQDALAVEALYELFAVHKIKPFVMAGVGYSKDDFVAQGNPQFAWQIGQPTAFANRDESTNSWLLTLGGGVKYALSSNKFIQADMRYFFSDSDTDSSNLYASIGLGMHFGTVPVKYTAVNPEPVVEVKPEPVVEVKPEPVVEVKPEPVVEVKPEPKVVKLRNLKADNLFAKGSAVLAPKAALELDAAIVASGVDLKALKMVKVVGHADRTGNAVSNQKLSERRAEAVKALLIKKGVAENIITTQGKGSTQPVTSLKQCPKSLVGIKLSTCLAPDRRIEITME
ncbi:MAG TPA: OmpA family protein [Agitococcus sp.]|nr:OmpA family protein [Agitococcus sp.]